MNRNFFRSFDSQAYFVSADLHNRDHDVIVNDDGFVFFARQNQHSTQLSQGVAGAWTAEQTPRRIDARVKRSVVGKATERLQMRHSSTPNGPSIVGTAESQRQGGDRNKALALQRLSSRPQGPQELRVNLRSVP
jgi:hypothetical protein